MSHVTNQQRTRVRERRSANEHTILEAFESALATRAFADVTVEEVMTNTGLGRTAFYRYFPDLESVLMRQLAELNDGFVIAASRWLAADADPKVGMFDAAIELATLYRDHAGLLRAFSEAASAAPDIDRSWLGLVDGFIARVINRLGEFRAAGLTTIDQPEETARALVWMTERYLQETYGRHRDIPLRVAAETITQIWQRTLFDAA